jgi:hypothetical protein
MNKTAPEQVRARCPRFQWLEVSGKKGLVFRETSKATSPIGD